MALTPKKQKRKPRIRALMSGAAGIGKTVAATSFPDVYVIDIESGCEHYEADIVNRGGYVFDNSTGSYEAVKEKVRELMSEDHSFTTLVIDPLTTLYEKLVDEGGELKTDEWGRDTKWANKKMSALMRLVAELDMNVILTSHKKFDYKSEKETFDGWKKSDYIVDIHFHIERDEQNRRIATVVKTRLPGFQDQGCFEWSYEEVARRFGKELLERKADQSVRAGEELAGNLAALLCQLTAEERTRLNIDKALKGYDSLADLPAERAQKGIEVITNYIKKPEGV